MSQPTAAVTGQPPLAIRCAIYTRKSSDEGLDQEYNSLEAQRDAGLAFIASQRHEGWMALDDGYDDGGFSGGNMERPGLRRLLAEIEAKRVEPPRLSWRLFGLSHTISATACDVCSVSWR